MESETSPIPRRKQKRRQRKKRGRGSITWIREGYALLCVPRKGELPKMQRRFHGTEDEAEDELRRMREEASIGIPVDKLHATVNDCIDGWLKEKRTKKQATTGATYARQVGTHVRPFIGTMKARMLKPEDIEKIVFGAQNRSRVKSMKGRPLSETMQEHLLANIHGALEWGVKNKLVSRNVAKGIVIEKSEGDTSTGVALEYTDVVRLQAAAARGPLEAIIMLALNTGLRRGEICGLRWSDVNCDTGELRVRRSIANVDGEAMLKPGAEHLGGRCILKGPKSKTSVRDLDMPSMLCERLKRHKQEQSEYRMRMGHGRAVPERDWVFQSDTGRHWDPNDLSKCFHDLVKGQAGVPNIRFHDCRHTFATHAITQGVPISIVSSVLGHSSIAITYRVYGHLLKDGRRQVADAMERLARRHDVTLQAV